MSAFVNNKDGDLMWELASRLFPIYRCLVNEGVKESLEIIREYLDISIQQYPSGQEVFDWVIPNSWEVNVAYIKDSDGNTIVDIKDNALHLAAYSSPINKVLSGAKLRDYIDSLPDMP